MSPSDPTLFAQDLISASDHIGYRWDMRSDEIMWVGPWEILFGSQSATPPASGEALSACILPNDHHLIFSETAPSFDREYRFRGKEGHLIWVHEHGTTDYENGVPLCQQGILRIIETSNQQNGEAYTSPDRDSLTGRPNLSCMRDVIDKILSGPDILREKTAYLAVGIDKLAFFNEAMGTKIGDMLICAVADRLNALCPTRALVGRVSGDTFGILLPGLARDAEALSNKILKSFHDHAVSTQETCLHMSVCIGSLVFDPLENDASALMIHAEQALLEARTKGRSQYVNYIESEHRSARNRAVLEIGEKVKQALKDNTLRLAFQPVFNSQTNEIEFYEVLSRMFDDRGALIPAGDFIPVVEQLGIAPEFDRHVLLLSIKELSESPDLRLAVNISGLTAALPDWPDFVQKHLRDKPDVASRMIIEITENAAVLDIAKIRCLVDSLRDMGSQVALDDFGAGSTSIRHLRDLSLAIMKIDRDLLNNILTSPEQQHLVRMITSMAHGLGLRTVAEGIECEEVAQWLRDENIDMLQGFHLGRPSLDRPWRETSSKETSSYA